MSIHMYVHMRRLPGPPATCQRKTCDPHALKPAVRLFKYTRHTPQPA